MSTRFEVPLKVGCFKEMELVDFFERILAKHEALRLLWRVDWIKERKAWFLASHKTPNPSQSDSRDFVPPLHVGVVTVGCRPCAQPV